MSASVILSKQLETESAELKEHISKFFDEKAKEFASSMKVQMDSFVDRKLTNYYHQEDSTPFKDVYLRLQQTQFHPIYHLTFSRRFYTVASESNSGKGITTTIPHKLTPSMIKIILKVSDNGCPYSRIIRLIDHPEYFMTDSTEFETTCRKEYALIESKKQELDSLLEEEQQKKDYYAELEERIKTVETKEKEIEIERQKLSEERAYLLEVKRKLALMKEEVEKEKAQIKSVNLDDFN